MMCASTVQVAALPANKTIVKERKAAPDLEPMRALLTFGGGLLSPLIVEIWESIIVSYLPPPKTSVASAPLSSPMLLRLQDFLIGSHISAIKSSIGKRGIIMENIDLCGIIQLLRSLVAQKKATEKEARKILFRIAAQTGASIVISF